MARQKQTARESTAPTPVVRTPAGDLIPEAQFQALTRPPSQPPDLSAAELEQAVRASFVPPSPKQAALLARFDKGPTKNDRKRLRKLRKKWGDPRKSKALDELEAFVAAADKSEQRSSIYQDLERKVRLMATQFPPGTIAAVLGDRKHFDFPAGATNEKSINARLFRARQAGFAQPVSPTAKRRRSKT